MYICLIFWSIPAVLSRHFNLTEEPPIFKDDQIIYSSNYTISSILVPFDGKCVQSSDIPSIFFTILDTKLSGGSSVYVLEDFSAYEVLEGGRDMTADYGYEKTVYIGAKDGLYKYNPETLSAKPFGVFKDDIIQIQKANGTDLFYILTADHQMFKLAANGTVRTKVEIDCAKEFVLDTSNNIYYLSCVDRLPHILLANGKKQYIAANVLNYFRDIKLLRPAFIMDDCVPFFVDGALFNLYSNGTCHRNGLVIKEKPTAYSIDAALYLVAALNGKLYEFNVMEVLMNTVYGLVDELPSNVGRMVVSMIETVKESRYSFYLV